MKALILNGSARGGKGVTGKMVNALIRGLAKGKAESTTFEIRRMSISPCTGCLSCMHKNPGICAVRDDMEPIYQALKASDLLVLATPLYVDTMSAQLKTVMDRCLACLQPFLIRDDTGRVRHPYTWRMPAKFLLLSTSAFPEPEVFAALLATFHAQAANFGSKAAGAICIPGSIALQVEPVLLDRHLSLLEEAGKILAGTGSIPGTLLQELNTPPVDVDRYLQVAARYEDWCREQLNKARRSREDASI